MERMKPQFVLLALACVVVSCSALGAQTFKEIPATAVHEKPIEAVAIKSPFNIATPDAVRVRTIEFLAADQMSAHDREVEANAESAISEHARYTGLEFNTGLWTYEQVICPAFPEHLFLRFMRNNGTGDVSLFTASIPRNNEGRVRIIPIQLRGYSLFSPAPINALTISAFNHIRAEENPENGPVSAWLGTGLCYAALAGGRPQLPAAEVDFAHAKMVAMNKGYLEVPGNGGATISFDDVSATPKPMHWSMIFDGKGKLVKASHSAAEMLSITSIKPTPVGAGKAVAANPPGAGTKIAAPAPSEMVMHPVAAPPSVKDFAPVSAGTGDMANPAGPPGL